MAYERDYDNVSITDPNVPFSYISKRKISSAEIQALKIPRWHEQIELKLILSGCGEISCGSKLFLANKGELVIVNSCELHSVTPIGNEELCYHLLMISPSLLYSEIIGMHLKDNKLCFNNHIQGDTVCNKLFTLLFDELMSKEQSYELAATGYISLLFSELLRNHRANTPTQAIDGNLEMYAEILAPAFSIISESYASEINLKSLAEACGKSVYYFCHIFKNLTGKSVIAYLNEYRINKAELLLCSTELSVADIAASVGFFDQSYFSKIFKKIKGQTPSECKKSKFLSPL